MVPAVGTQPSMVEQSGSLLAAYGHWLVRIATLDVGVTVRGQAVPVLSIVGEAIVYTLVYFLPALLFAVVVGTGVRLYTVSTEGDRLDRITDLLAFVAVSVPSFLLVYAMKWWLLPYYFRLADTMRAGYVPALGPFAAQNLGAAVWPLTAIGLYLLGIQLRYAGVELGEYAHAAFVKTARAKGASPWRVGLHIFRNTAVSLLTLFFTDMFGLTLLGVYVVEWVSNTPGFGRLTIDAVGSRIRPMLFLVVLLPIAFGVAVNLLQDVGYAAFDPRVDYDD